MNPATVGTMTKPPHWGDWANAPVAMTPEDAATYLEDKLPEGSGYWQAFLVNNRRPDRNPAYRIPAARVRGRITYRQSDLDAFVSYEKVRRLSREVDPTSKVMAAYGLGAPEGGPLGRTLNYAVQPVHVEGRRHTVQLTIHDPLLVFSLSPQEARTLASRLESAASTKHQ